MRIGITSENAEDVHSVYDWLRGDQELRGVDVVAVPSADRSLMSAVDSVLMVCTAVSSMAAVAQSLAAWRACGRSRVITVERPDGGRMTLDASAPGTAEVLERFLGSGGGTDRG